MVGVGEERESNDGDNEEEEERLVMKKKAWQNINVRIGNSNSARRRKKVSHHTKGKIGARKKVLWAICIDSVMRVDYFAMPMGPIVSVCIRRNKNSSQGV
jgi:hypothetical protein